MAEIKIKKNSVKTPLHISFSGWKKIGIRIKDQIGENNLEIISAGVAFYAFLAVFPAMVALISIYGLAFDPQQIEQQLLQLASVMPEDALSVMEDQLKNFVSSSGKTLGWGTAIGILFSLWSANKGTKSLFLGINIIYHIGQKRGFFKQNAISLLFTLGAIFLVILCMAFIVAFPAFVDYLPLPESVKNLIGWLRWVVLALIVVSFLCLVYKYAPVRKAPKLKWVLTGAVLTTVLWLLASWGFSYYVKNFGNYGEVYGSISAVVVLMLWLLLTSFFILLGAVINSEIEYHALEEPT